MRTRERIPNLQSFYNNAMEINNNLRLVNTSNYNMTPTIATVGTDGASDALRAAISTGSIEAVKAVINGAPAPLDQTPDQQAVQAAASAAAQQAYAAALAAGDDEATAMAKAQQAANAVVNQAAAGQ